MESWSQDPYAKEARFASLAAALESLTSDQLKDLLTVLPNPPRKLTRKGDLVAAILDYLSTDESLRAVWARLDEIQRAAVSEVIHAATPVFDTVRFRAKYGREPNWGARRGQYGYRMDPSPLALFFFKGTIPDDLRARLRGFAPPPTPTTLASVEDLPATYQLKWTEYDYETHKRTSATEEFPVVRRLMERSAQDDLLAVLQLASAGKLAVGEKTGYPSATSVAAVAAVLSGGDFYPNDLEAAGIRTPEWARDWEEAAPGPIRAFAWPLILQAAGLAVTEAKRLRLTKAGTKALLTTPAETLRVAWRKWMANDAFDEFRRVDAIKGQQSKSGRALTSPPKRRAVIGEAFRQCPVGRWVDVGRFHAFMTASGLDFDVARNPFALYISDTNYGNLGYAGSSILEGRYLLCLLFEYAATLGLVDVAYVHPAGVRADYSKLWGTDDLLFLSRYDGLLAFRLTRLGAYCLGVEEEYVPPAVEVRPVLSVTPSLDVVLVRNELPAADVLQLDTYAERLAADRWRLDEARLLAASEQGRDLDGVAEWLEARSIQPLPPEVERFLAGVAERAGSLRPRGSALLIECRTHELAERIATDPKTKSLCLLAGDRFLAVPAKSEERFRKALRLMGFGMER